jgi:hypothetical protein
MSELKPLFPDQFCSVRRCSADVQKTFQQQQNAIVIEARRRLIWILQKASSNKTNLLERRAS